MNAAIEKRVKRVIKITLAMVSSAIIVTIISWLIPLHSLDIASDAMAITTLCIAAYLMGLAHAHRIIERDNEE